MKKKEIFLSAFSLLCMTTIFWSCDDNIIQPSQSQQIEVEEFNPETMPYILNVVAEDLNRFNETNTYSTIDNKTNKKLPSSADLTNQFPAVVNQGRNAAAVGYALAYNLKTCQEGFEEERDINKDQNIFSPFWIYNQINSGVDRGASLLDGLQLIVDRGCDDIVNFPYSNDYKITPDAASFRRAQQYKADSWAFVENLNDMKGLLANNEAIVCRFDVYFDFYKLTFENEVYDNVDGRSIGGHAACIIGYDDTKQAFKYINSWGTDYGLNGYGWLSYSLVEDYSTLNFQAYVLKDAPNQYFTEYTGYWDNEDHNTRGITKVIVLEGSNQLRLFGSCVPRDCDWGFTDLIPIEGGYTAYYDQGFATRDVTVTRLGDDRLKIVVSTVYTDERKDSILTYYFRKTVNPNGTWKNKDTETNGVTTLKIFDSASKLQAFSVCEPIDCDWGIEDLHVDHSRYVSINKPDWGTKEISITPASNGELKMDIAIIFPEESEQENYTLTYYFIKN